jgi:hypothetical protein
MAFGMHCRKCGLVETAHQFPEAYPATEDHRYRSPCPICEFFRKLFSRGP